jgi:hypothetical protein
VQALQQKGGYDQIAQKYLNVAKGQMQAVLEQNKNIYF